MEQILNIKEIEVRKWINNTALRNGFYGFIIVSLFSILSSTSLGEIIICGILYGCFGFGIIYFKGRSDWNKLKKKYKSPKYAILNEIGLSLNEHLYFEGVYRNYFLNIIPIKNRSKDGNKTYYDVIQIFFQSDIRTQEYINDPLAIKYHIGYLYFYNMYVIKTYTNTIEIDFKNDLDYIISVLNREDYLAISKAELSEI